MKKTDPTAPSNKYIKLVTSLPRKIASILTQQTGHGSLAKHLYHIRKSGSPICPACQWGEESVQHFLLHCQAHQTARQTLHTNTGGWDINIMKLFTTPKMLHTLFKYMAEMGCFHSALGDIPMLDKEHQRGSRHGDRR